MSAATDINIERAKAGMLSITTKFVPTGTSLRQVPRFAHHTPRGICLVVVVGCRRGCWFYVKTNPTQSDFSEKMIYINQCVGCHARGIPYLLFTSFGADSSVNGKHEYPTFTCPVLFRHEAASSSSSLYMWSLYLWPFKHPEVVACFKKRG